MRWLGRKTWLTPLLEALLKGRCVPDGASFLDAFAGTATVARAMKAAGYRVATNDLMAVSTVVARGTLGARRLPQFAGLLARRELQRFALSENGIEAINAVEPPDTRADVLDAVPLRTVLAYLNSNAPEEHGFVWRQFSPGGRGDRRFFTQKNAARIDGALAVIGDWRQRGWIDLTERDVLLTALVDAADRVANISGIYGAFLKKWQANAKRDLALESPPIVTGTPAKVFRKDANELVASRHFDVVYVDPPYNERQYAKNYHVLEAIAEWLDVQDKAAYEASVRGKTGMLDLPGRESAYCGRSAQAQFSDLIASARADHVIVSYSEEGMISCEGIMTALMDACPSFDPGRDFVALGRKRFRSDTNDSRAYRVLEGRKRDEVAEWLFYASKGSKRRNPGGPSLREIAKVLEEVQPCS